MRSDPGRSVGVRDIQALVVIDEVDLQQVDEAIEEWSELGGRRWGEMKCTYIDGLVLQTMELVREGAFSDGDLLV
ncbi:unnamed protein product [Phytophthora lilii]|uniref:Unnamed protein product n=1 Tax=Phytophthora lilii TaxID=2077276 RepID=A0A9W6U2N5_9STRA|nr:unnamed protein product [Phytophthora lilii]